jgi:predicted HD phosphohydrolase
MQVGESVSFTRMLDGTKADYDLLARAGKPYFDAVPERLLGVLEPMREVFVSYQVSSLEHLLQTASRAERDGVDGEMIVAALHDDIGDAFTPDNHSEFAPALLRPHVREEVHWVIRHHGSLQLYYYGRHEGVAPNLRERYRSTAHFDACAAFCAPWDQTSFDRADRSEPLDHLAPMLRRISIRRPPHPVSAEGMAI